MFRFDDHLHCYIVATHGESRPPAGRIGTRLIELDTLDQYIYTTGGWVFERNLRHEVAHTQLWNTETWEWEAATKGSGVGLVVAVENFPAVISGANIPVTGAFYLETQPISGTVNLGLTSQYTLRLDEATSVITYIGEAAAGASESASVWRIKKIDMTSGIIIKWADGNTNMDNVWTNRTSLNYS